ncbi:MAG TPA: DHA2 family efflux MFS transporter permease subunit [Candidatus Saccharimonadales bacterium]|nr:DHA2 family efflux MFS transporter permease subunit [Candidatus Saccharimonadales bacterium]
MTRSQRLVLVVSILASFVAFLDSSVVNVALPAISRELGGSLVIQQWVVDAYLITLGSLILLAGSLSDLFGRRRILTAGLIGFGMASLLCAVAPSSLFLIFARAVQGIAGALLVPSSLALIMSSFSGEQQSKAIGRWTAWTGISFIVGPLVGGFLVDSSSWRLVFAINIVPIACCLWLLRMVAAPSQTTHAKLDVIGALLCSAGLAATVFGLIEQPHLGWGSGIIVASLAVGLFALLTFVWYEAHTSTPMLPLSLFTIRNFATGNFATLSIYGGLSVATFLIIIYLQQVAGYSAFLAGLALLPVTIVMFLLSPRFGAWSSTYGVRLFMTAGPCVAGIGFLLMLRIGTHMHYWSQLFPGTLVFALGLSMTVAPLTAAVLRDVAVQRSGIASAVNNAVSRIAGLIMVALAGVIVGPHLDRAGLRKAIITTAVLLVCGGVVSWFGIRDREAVH